MQLRQVAALTASTAFFFFPANVKASLLRGVDGEFEIGDTLEITEDRPGTFVRVSESDTDTVHYSQSSAIIYRLPRRTPAVVSFTYYLLVL